jgi:hypothetical protein
MATATARATAADGADPDVTDVRILSELVVSACASCAKAAEVEKVTN